MRTGFKSVWTTFLAANLMAVMVLTPSTNAFACTPKPSPLEAPLNAEKEKLTGNMYCRSTEYGNDNSRCQKCYTEVKKWIPKFKEAADLLIQQDKAAICHGEDGILKAANGGLDGQRTQFKSNDEAVTTARTAAMARFNNATGGGAVFKECKKAVKDYCEEKLVEEDVKLPRALHAACEHAETKATSFAASKSSDSLSLGDLSKAMTLGAQGLGMAAQLANMAKQNAGQGSALTADPNSTVQPGAVAENAAPTIESSKLAADKSAANSATFGNPVVAASTTTSDSGNGSTTGASSFDSRSGKFGGGPSFGPHDGGGSFAAGKGDSSGASSPSTGGRGPVTGSGGKTGPDSSASGSNYEITGGGGLSARAMMMGIKPGKSELDDLADANGKTPEAKLDGFGGERDLASGEGATEADLQASGESIFSRVHTKIFALNKTGRL